MAVLINAAMRRLEVPKCGGRSIPNRLTGKCWMSSASTVVDDYGRSSVRIERTPVAGEIAQKFVELPIKYPGALCVGTPAAL